MNDGSNLTKDADSRQRKRSRILIVYVRPFAEDRVLEDETSIRLARDQKALVIRSWPSKYQRENPLWRDHGRGWVVATLLAADEENHLQKDEQRRSNLHDIAREDSEDHWDWTKDDDKPNYGSRSVYDEPIWSKCQATTN